MPDKTEDTLDMCGRMVDKEIAHRAVEVLNRALEADREAVTALFNTRLRCNEKLADDPTIQVGGWQDGKSTIGPLGIINGIIGIQENGWGYIAARYDSEELKSIVAFEMIVDAGDTDDV